MNNKSIAVAVLLFVLIVAGMFIFAYLKKAEAPTELPPAPDMPVVAEPTPYDTITQVTAKHFYIDGTHTLAGEVLLPTPCDLLDWNVRTTGSESPAAIIDFTVKNSADMCAQVVTPARFMVTFTGPEDMPITATFVGRAIGLNLLEPLEGETPDSFELFIKG